MCIPENKQENIREFIDRYFIEDAMPDDPAWQGERTAFLSDDQDGLSFRKAFVTWSFC